MRGGIILEFRTEHALIENNIFNNKAYGISFNTRAPGNYGGDNLPNPGGTPPGGYSYLLNNVMRNNLFTNLYTGQGIGNSFAIGVISEGTDDPQINGFSVYNNTIIGRSTNPSYMGIDLSSMPQGNGQNINIRNNIIQGFGAYPVRGSNPTNITGCFVTHNDFYLNGNNNAVSWPGGNPANYTYNNNISQNPLFVSATNFSLQATSPCIDAGVNVGIPYNGSAPDMGYVEYGTTGNIPPTANAGPDQTITLPTNTVSLTGTGIDPDGNITAYLWTKIAGPAAGTITNPNNAATTVTGLVQGVYRFELRVTDNNNAYGRDTVQITVNAASNIPPTANAGPDQTITLPTNTVSLSGSGIDPDGNITAYLWTKIAGPAAGTITNPNNAATTVTGLVQGVYRFELRVTDNNNAFGRDTVQITVNAASNIPPTANAGPDQTIILPTNVVIVSGSGTDPDGFITAYLWTKISGPANGTITNPNVAATSITGLVQGIYRFELRVTDNNGAFGRDTMQVTVNAGATNTPPSANAGPNQTITLPTNTVILSGSGIDPDGFITAYLWTKVAGPAAGTITNPNSAATSVTGLVQGVYQFELRVTDNNNAFGRDTVQITVNAASNIPPTANAGPDQTITLPTNTVSLSGTGTDPDGNITAWLWTKVSGPAAGTITNPNSAATTVTGMVQGVYRFELRVTDNNNAFGRDTVQITVNAASNIPPTANAGADQTIILPTNTVSLSGTGIDPDGFITAYLWTKVSGPANGTITNPNSAATTVTGLVQGVYRFELRVTDNNGAFGRDTVQVTVIPGATNTPPSANAGTDQSITLPVNSVILSGSGIDPDGIITAYLWTTVAGPAAGTITNPNSAATSVTGLLQGVYRFELRVTDNSGAFGRDTVQVTVNTASNIAPTANAGPDQNITLPANSVSLTGAGTDPDGNITAWLWTKVAGPAAGTITNTNTAATAVTGLVEGVYQFELRVTDNNNAVGRDTIRVTVYPVPNNPPTANAGPNLTITLPDNTATLTGTGTDTDGSIVAYNWRQVTGPSGNVLFSTNTAITFLTNLVEGTYEFELTVTDNRGATASDLVIVVVIGTSGNQLQYNDINVYPNPVADIATLEIKASVLNSKQTVTITDMHGKIVFRKDLSYAQQNFNEKIDMRNLIKGTYIVTVYFENGEKKNMKIVKM
ncbi:MAG: T9SS type A sorting domain-containing protein [Chitinophagaceae bacterium]|nr:T9SS type A sorting domain-containing protein [Chitinophagaceae bacterium]